MIGLNVFSEHFREFSDHYVVIGGAACDDHFRDQGLLFRATKDIDMILVVEALNDDFITHFWEFVRNGRYGSNEVANERNYYRFIKPDTDDFPAQVELFSKTPDVITPNNEMKFTPIPAGETISSLSAILMDDDYYNFTLKNSVITENIHRANDIALICLKAKAFLDLTVRKNDGQLIDSKQIKKHKNDVFRLAATLSNEEDIEVPLEIKKDITQFIEQITLEAPDVRQLLKTMGITSLGTEDLLNQLKSTFEID